MMRDPEVANERVIDAVTTFLGSEPVGVTEPSEVPPLPQLSCPPPFSTNATEFACSVEHEPAVKHLTVAVNVTGWPMSEGLTLWASDVTVATASVKVVVAVPDCSPVAVTE